MNTNDRIGHTPLILSDQVEDKINTNISDLLKNSELKGYFEFASGNFSLVRSGSELKHS